ncbi:type II secretion system F family protein [Xanthomonas cerealis pv. cerealis]|uniref:Type II secretion system F family protein n=1 Tax=Xanthomonas cerealis pv. cerealis TaxID=152263 RepID=A0A514EH63_9XANT|nr:type II secretion system F family protein [Xanthomonas translucens]QDI05380.1 type II secretion system F family protein [Xanthomonas translucens pv. cerealis]
MTWMLAFVALLAAGAVALVVIGTRGVIREVELEDRTYYDPLPRLMQLMWPLVTVLTRRIAPHLRVAQLEQTHRHLQAAGQDYTLSPEEFYGLRMASALVVIAFFLLCTGMLGHLGIGSGLMCLMFGGLLGWLYPALWLGERRKARHKTVVRDLPIYLDFITMSVEAGLNVTGGIEQAVAKGPAGALSQEFSRMLRDLRAGLPRAEALRRMAERMDIAQITSFTSALIQADRVGANLSDTLRAQANQRREERFLRAEKLALEAPVKMMLPLVMFFFPLIFLFLGYFIYLKMLQEGIL